MFARVGGAKSEATIGAPPSINHTVVVVEGFVHGDGQGEFRIGFEAVARGVELFGFVLSYAQMRAVRILEDEMMSIGEDMPAGGLTDDEGVFGKFLVETFGRAAIEEEVEGMRWTE